MEGKQGWVRSFKVPEVYDPISKDLPVVKGRKEATQFLLKDQWEPIYLTLARTIDDALVVGKP